MVSQEEVVGYLRTARFRARLSMMAISRRSGLGYYNVRRVFLKINHNPTIRTYVRIWNAIEELTAENKAKYEEKCLVARKRRRSHAATRKD